MTTANSNGAAPSRRFYSTVSVEPAAAIADSATAGGWAICLDNKPIRTPAKAPLVVPLAGLAERIAAEWRQQGERIEPATLLVTQIATTAIDRVAPERDAVVAVVASYAESDLLCHRATHPATLRQRQNDAWHPIVEWAAAALDAGLHVADGIMPVAQPAAALATIRRVVAEHDDLRLAALSAMTAGIGSILLPLAVSFGRLSAKASFAAGHVDEDYQAERWGDDHEAVQRRARMWHEYEAAAMVLLAKDASGQ